MRGTPRSQHQRVESGVQAASVVVDRPDDSPEPGGEPRGVAVFLGSRPLTRGGFNRHVSVPQNRERSPARAERRMVVVPRGKRCPRPPMETRAFYLLASITTARSDDAA